MTELLLEALAAPVLSLKSAEARVYAPYLLGAGLIGLSVWAAKLRNKISLLGFLFPRSIWLHPSALFDLRFMVARALLNALLLAPLVLSTSFIAVYGQSWLEAHVWRFDAAFSPQLALAGVTLTAFVFEDLARYWVHRWAHRVPALWELHKVHHSAEVLTPFSIYRTHPIEGLLMRTAATSALATGAALSAWLLGASLQTWQVLGVQGLSFAWNLAGSNLRHSHIWLSYPRCLQPLFISPAAHQVHHSKSPEHYDHNFGSALGLWDALFGTLYYTGKRERFAIGIADSEQNHQLTVLSALLAPLRAATSRLLPTRSAQSLADGTPSKGPVQRA